MRTLAVLVVLGIALTLCVCTPSPQLINICKKTVPAGNGGFPFIWSQGSAGTSTTPFVLNDGQCYPANVASLDHYNVFTENPPSGWWITNISCNQQTSPVKFIGGNANPAFQPGDNAVAIDLNEPNVVCTFVNERLPTCCAYTLNLSTGQGNGPGDAIWTVNNGTAFITPPVSAWTTLPSAQWIQPVASPVPSSAIPSGVFGYETEFTVPNCPFGHVELTGTFAADNDAAAFLDGTPIAGASCGSNCFTTPVSINVPSVAPGLHTLQITVTNQSSWSGLIVNAQVRTVCP